MLRHRLTTLALFIALADTADTADAASLTPPNLVTASSLSNQDLLLVWPYAAGGPLEAMSWSTFTAQMQAALGASFLARSNNLSDLANQTTARTNLGLGTAATTNTGTSGATVCLLNSSCTVSGAQTYTAEILAAPSSSTRAGLNLSPGTGPSSPSNGDVWTTAGGIFVRIGGSTEQIDAPVVVTNWTPTITFSTPGNLNVVYSSQSGRTLQILGASQNLCISFFAVATSTFTFTTASGAFGVAGLSPTPNPTFQAQASGTPSAWGGFAGLTYPPLLFTGGGSAINIRIGANSASTASTGSFATGTNINLSGTFTYIC